jgi:hypothetical protein
MFSLTLFPVTQVHRVPLFFPVALSIYVMGSEIAILVFHDLSDVCLIPVLSVNLHLASLSPIVP